MPIRNSIRPVLFIAALTMNLCICLTSHADGPADNQAAAVRRVPKLGIEVPAEERAELEKSLAEFEELLAPLRGKKELAHLLPDVLVYHKAVHDALKYQEIFDAKELPVAHELLAEGKERATALAKGESPWLDKPGPVVRGYISRIDGSVQPYGLVLPTTLNRKSPYKHRLDFWFHGRGEVLSELNFINDRRKNPGQFTPPDTIVLHPYGRYCNANKFAGEIDSLEALEAVQRDYRIDDDRISVRGFSMGGAACWQFAVHYSDRWFAAAPGAGFSETPDFLKVFQKEELKPTWYERKLWHWYDCTDYALNLVNLPTIAYSGEKDSQKQAADVMAAAMEKEGMHLLHIIGPDTGHSYEPAAKAEIDRRMDALALTGRKRVPTIVHFTTYTLRYPKMHWVRIDGLEQHWERATVFAQLNVDRQSIGVAPQNVSDLTLEMGPGEYPGEFAPGHPTGVNNKLTVSIPSRGPAGFKPDTFEVPVNSDGSWRFSAYKQDGKWIEGLRTDAGLRKRPGLQGPIDDAFMDSFIFVRPTGKCAHESIDRWVHAELDRAIEHWRRHFRGEARVKDDIDITEEDVKSSNLILWGDAVSNKLIAEHYREPGRLPINWTDDSITLGQREYAAEHHALIAIYPNPKNPARYVVLNSSFTFRDFAYLNNARQVAKLPDWAVVDVRTPPDALWPGKIVDANFFDEEWNLK